MIAQDLLADQSHEQDVKQVTRTAFAATDEQIRKEAISQTGEENTEVSMSLGTVGCVALLNEKELFLALGKLARLPGCGLQLGTPVYKL